MYTQELHKCVLTSLDYMYERYINIYTQNMYALINMHSKIQERHTLNLQTGSSLGPRSTGAGSSDNKLKSMDVKVLKL